jgi:hypothetical protein
MQAGVTTRMIHGMCPAFPLAVPVAERGKLDAATLARAAARGDDEEEGGEDGGGAGSGKTGRKGAGATGRTKKGGKAAADEASSADAAGASSSSSSSLRPPLVACLVGKLESSYGAVIDTGDTVRYPGA